MIFARTNLKPLGLVAPLLLLVAPTLMLTVRQASDDAVRISDLVSPDLIPTIRRNLADSVATADQVSTNLLAAITESLRDTVGITAAASTTLISAIRMALSDTLTLDDRLATILKQAITVPLSDFGHRRRVRFDPLLNLDDDHVHYPGGPTVRNHDSFGRGPIRDARSCLEAARRPLATRLDCRSRRRNRIDSRCFPVRMHKYAYLYEYTQMTSKNLAVREEVYKKLLESKKGDESFSDVIERLLEGKQDLMTFAGILSHDKEFERINEDIEQVRKKTVVRN